MLGLVVGVLAIVLGAKAFTEQGLPLTKQKNLTGTPAKIVGVLCILLGALFVADGLFGAFVLMRLLSGG